MQQQMHWPIIRFNLCTCNKVINFDKLDELDVFCFFFFKIVRAYEDFGSSWSSSLGLVVGSGSSKQITSESLSEASIPAVLVEAVPFSRGGGITFITLHCFLGAKKQCRDQPTLLWFNTQIKIAPSVDKGRILIRILNRKLWLSR